jgi:hypothetical protein
MSGAQMTYGFAPRVLIPPGSGKADDGGEMAGPAQMIFEVPLARLLYFERQ